MKNIITTALATLILMIGFSQPQKDEAILTTYYAVKDALVKGDDKLAATSASELVKQMEAFTTSDKKAQQLKDKIKADASKIASASSLTAQREAFTPMSVNFFELAKLVDLSSSPVYQFYCPMKKAIWLSSENSVKNPYYGKQMLTCGSLQETLK